MQSTSGLDSNSTAKDTLLADAVLQESDGTALAKLYGEPLFDVPQDLYIPPDALLLFLEAFEGPLDLLLYLIRKQNFNVLDIPMAQLTQQYLAYVEQIRSYNLELAGEYLLMAAMLMEIKSRMLLPVKKADSDELVEDPRAELVRRLLEYEKIKMASQHLDQLPRLNRDYMVSSASAVLDTQPALAEVSVQDLQSAWQSILQRARVNANHHITKEQLSVREHMTKVLKQLSDHKFLEFQQLFQHQIQQGADVQVVVVHFLAILELNKEALIQITQSQAFEPIYVRLSYTHAAA